MCDLWSWRSCLSLLKMLISCEGFVLEHIYAINSLVSVWQEMCGTVCVCASSSLMLWAWWAVVKQNSCPLCMGPCVCPTVSWRRACRKGVILNVYFKKCGCWGICFTWIPKCLKRQLTKIYKAFGGGQSKHYNHIFYLFCHHAWTK